MGPELIGRQHPAAVLRTEAIRAAESHGGLVLVTGEAGIGKTSLVTRAAEEARERGTLVVGGSCWDSQSAPGYWPWTQIVRALRRTATPDEWADAEREYGGCLPALLGENAGAGRLRGSGTAGGTGTRTGPESGTAGKEPDEQPNEQPNERPDAPSEGPPDGGADSFRLHDAVTAALVAVAQSRPLMVVVDDLHRADSASLRLLEFAAQHTWFERILLVGTYRDVEVEAPGHPLRPLMLPLLSRATTLTLTGLDRAETTALMARTTGVEPDADLAGEVHERTGGNPFFVEQTARLWHSGGSVTAIAPGVRDALRHRLSLLPPPVAHLLSTASVLGRTFHRQWLAAVEHEPVPRIDRLLDQAVAARLVTAENAGRFSFAHDLVRETLYEALGPEQAGTLHAAAVHAADRSAALAAHVLPAELARHAYLADGALEPARAVELLEAAAVDAEHRFAHDESIGHCRRALERGEGVDARKLVLLALKLGDGLHHGGHHEEAWQVFEQAVGRARTLDDPALLARTALTLYRAEGQARGTALTDGLLHEAHARLDPQRPTPESEQRGLLDQLAQDLSARLTALARGASDDEFLSFGLWARHDTIWGPGTAAEREVLTREITAIAHRAGDPLAEVVAASLRWVALLERGDPRYLDQFRELASTAKRSGQVRGELMVEVDRCVLAIHRGRFAEAEKLLARITDGPAQGPLTHGSVLLHLLRWQLLLSQGRFEELAKLHAGDADEAESVEHGGTENGCHGPPHTRLREALTAVRRGDPAGIRTAASYVDQVLADGGEFPGELRAMWLRLLAQTSAATGSPELLRRAREALEPIRDEWAVSLFGADIGGPMSLWIAHLDVAQGRWDDAVDSFTEARRSADVLRLRVWSLEARNGLAAALAGRGTPDDVVRARALAEQVEREAHSLGIRHLVTSSGRLRARTAALPPPPRPMTARARRGEDSGGGTGTRTDTSTCARTSTSPGLEAAVGAVGAVGAVDRPPYTVGTGLDQYIGADLSKGTTEGTNEDGAEHTREGAGEKWGEEWDGRGLLGQRPEADTGEEWGALSFAGAGVGSRTDPHARGALAGTPGTPPGEGPTSAAPTSPQQPDQAGAPRTGPIKGAAPEHATWEAAEPSDEFSREGNIWRLRYEGRTVHMPDAKGLRDLHYLLGRPGTDIPAPRLLNPEGGEEVAVAHAMGGDPVLDEKAKASYKRRLEALDVEMDRASARGDAERSAECDREREALLAELRAAAGLAGRSRRLGDEAERARKTVTARIRDTLRKLDGRHPELAAHLRRSVSTGAACRYQSADPVSWRL